MINYVKPEMFAIAFTPQMDLLEGSGSAGMLGENPIELEEW